MSDVISGLKYDRKKGNPIPTFNRNNVEQFKECVPEVTLKKTSILGTATLIASYGNDVCPRKLSRKC